MTEDPPHVADDGLDDEWQQFVEAEVEPEPSPRGPRRPTALALAAAVVAVLVVVGIAVLRPAGPIRDEAGLRAIGVPSELHAAEISAVEQTDCLGPEAEPCLVVSFTLLAGPDTGAVYTQEFPPSALNPDFPVGRTAILSRHTPNATVVGVGEAPCPFDAAATCPELSLALDDPAGVTVAYVASPEESAVLLGEGDRATVEVFDGSDGPEAFGVAAPGVATDYSFTGDFQRRGLLLWVTLLFVVTVVAVGLWRGVAALGGLAASVGVLLLFVLPAILGGRPPVLVAVVGAAAIALIALYLAHGFTPLTHAALLGMVAALLLTAVLSAAAVELAHFSGFASEESTLLTLFEGIDVGGLLLAGIVLGTAGALDDVTVTQASAVWALAAADPGSGSAGLYRRAMRIGRDHIASTVNTLLLAYAGAALPLMVLFVLSEQSLGAIANSEVVAIEIIRTVVGSIGLVAAVPITTWLASRAAVGTRY